VPAPAPATERRRPRRRGLPGSAGRSVPTLSAAGQDRAACRPSLDHQRERLLRIRPHGLHPGDSPRRHPSVPAAAHPVGRLAGGNRDRLARLAGPAAAAAMTGRRARPGGDRQGSHRQVGYPPAPARRPGSPAPARAVPTPQRRPGSPGPRDVPHHCSRLHGIPRPAILRFFLPEHHRKRRPGGIDENYFWFPVS
jgi:hypothetical protein